MTRLEKRRGGGEALEIGLSGRLGAMLGFVDVNEPGAGPGSLGRR